MAGLRGQIITAIRDGMRNGIWTVKQKDLAVGMGITEKHLSQVLKAEAGTFEIFDKAAEALDCEWVVTLKHKAD